MPGNGNIHADPGFINSSERNFHLNPESPCIDAGDPESEPDPNGSRTDIGAFYSSGIRIVINEINFNSSDNFNPYDWVELYNPQDEPADISGWKFMDEDDSHLFEIPDNTTIDNFGYLTLCQNSALFHNLFPQVINYLGDFPFGLNGQGELIRLYNAEGILIDSLTFDDKAPWPEEPDGNGPTLALINPGLDNSLPENWRASDNYGTPGIHNDSTYGAVNSGEVNPEDFVLFQNYPNPFNPVTYIRYSLPAADNVTIEIFNILGQKIITLVNEKQDSGIHTVEFDADKFVSGIYFYRIRTDHFQETKKMVLIR